MRAVTQLRGGGRSPSFPKGHLKINWSVKPVERFRCTAPLRGRETRIVSEILLPFVLLENEEGSAKEWIQGRAFRDGKRGGWSIEISHRSVPLADCIALLRP